MSLKELVSEAVRDFYESIKYSNDKCETNVWKRWMVKIYQWNVTKFVLNSQRTLKVRKNITILQTWTEYTVSLGYYRYIICEY